ncbi:MAG: thioredoxin family protein [Bacteroidota bacterium]
MKYTFFILSLFFSYALFGQHWNESYTDALQFAKKENKPIILVFSGSDWCPPCKKLEKKIWQSEEFKTYAAKNYVLYNADFPRKKQNKLSEEKMTANKQLAEIYNPKGHFPLVVVMDQGEKILGKTSYKKATPNEYIAHLNSYIK